MALLLAALYLVYGFFVLYVIVQMVLRLALIDLLLALAPIALGLWILPHTAGWGRHWLRLFMTTVFQQAIQLIALALGFGFLNEVAAIAAFEPVQDLIWKLLLSLSFVYMATRVPSMLGNAGTFDFLALDALLRHEPALFDVCARRRPSGWWRAEPPEDREAWRWARWRPARAFRPPPAASARRPRWPPHRQAETAAESPGAAGSSPTTRQRTGADERAPTNTTTEEKRCAANGAKQPRPVETSGTLGAREEKRNGTTDTDHIEPGGHPAGRCGGHRRRASSSTARTCT